MIFFNSDPEKLSIISCFVIAQSAKTLSINFSAIIIFSLLFILTIE